MALTKATFSMIEGAPVNVLDFGAVGNGVADDTAAIQAALNSAPPEGLKLYFPAGTYKTTAPLIPKVVVGTPTFAYNLTVMGDGPNVSIIKAFHGGNVFTITQGQASFTGRESSLFFNMLTISGNYQASHCIYADYIAGMKLVDCVFSNANTAQVRIGVDPTSESYGIDVRNCYMNNNAANSGMATAGLYLFQARYVYIDRLTVDGAAYGVFMDGCDKGFIQNCHLEGPKIASLWIQGSGGGEHKIANNMFFPYVGFDASAKFDGVLYGLYMTGSAGGNAFNNVIGNVFIVGQAGLPIKTTITGATGGLIASPSLLVTGGTSGATGYLDGYVSGTGKALIRVVSGTFQAAEVITQATTGGTGTLGVIVNPDSVGLFTAGSSAYHNIVGNQIRIQPKAGIVLQATGCNVSENVIASANGGTAIYKDTPVANLIGNVLEAPGGGNAIWNVSGSVNSVANYIISGALPGLNAANDLADLAVRDNLLQRTAGDFIQTLTRGSTDLFKLSNSGTANVYLNGCNGATIWLGSSNTGSRTSSTIGVNSSGQLLTVGIPTSSAGLPSGAVYSNGGVLTIV
jgi:hypothetical protein